jgi:NADPH:quinone reductase-like Zn-dependent oxidoreductase
MKAAVYTKYGPPEVVQIKEVNTPAPKDNEVLVKVFASTVNRTDCGFRKPEYPVIIRPMHGLFKPKKKILGTEFAGVVELVGKDVKLFKQDERVFGLTGNNFGAHAEYLCLSESGAIATMPDNISFEEAAAVNDGVFLALNYLKEINISNAHNILIYGASGSIGSAGVQLAKYFGAEVTAVCNTKNIEIVKSLGADKVIDYTKEDFTKLSQTFDFVFDAVGKTSFFKTKHLLKKNGIYFSTELGFLAQNPFLALLKIKFDGKKIIFPVPKENKEDIIFIGKLLASGKYKAVIDRKYPLEQIVDAYRYVETGQKTGNVVITF